MATLRQEPNATSSTQPPGLKAAAPAPESLSTLVRPAGTDIEDRLSGARSTQAQAASAAPEQVRQTGSGRMRPSSRPMLLTELAEYLRLPPPTIEHLIERRILPGVRARGRWEFRRAEVDQWLDFGMPGWDPSVHRTVGGIHEYAPSSLQASLSEHNVILGLSARSLVDAIEKAIGKMELPPTTNRRALVAAILERERLCSTALGNGFAIPHTSRSAPRLVASNVAALIRLQAPVRTDGGNDTPVDLILFVFAQDPVSHLQLLSRAARLALEPSFGDALRASPQPQSVLRLVRQMEHRLFPPTVVGHIQPWQARSRQSARAASDRPIGQGGNEESVSWEALRALYAGVRSAWEAGLHPQDTTAVAVAELVKGQLARDPATPDHPPVARKARRVDGRLQDYAARALRVVLIERARRAAIVFEDMRRSLEEAGFGRALAWRLCLALRQAGLIMGEPNRPYLSPRAQAAADRLLSEVGFRAQAVEDLEAGLMIAGERRLETEGNRVDAEVLTEACLRLVGRSRMAQR